MPKKLPKIISKEEFDKLFNAIDKSKRIPKDTLKQYKLAILLGAESGMRISEVVGLKKAKSKCCNADIRTIKVHKEIYGARKRVNEIYCENCDKKILRKDTRRTKEDEWDIKPLTKDKIEPASIRLEGAKGQKDRVVPRPKRMNETAIKMLPLTIQRRALQSFVEELGKRVLNKHINFHRFRHYFGSQCAESMPLHQVQMLMGHSSIGTTGIYLHANPKDAIEKVREEVFG